MNKFKILLITVISLITFGMPFIPATANATSSIGDACAGIHALDSNSNADCSHTAANQGAVNNIVRTAINLLSIIVGIASVIVIIIAGFRFVTAGGDSNTVSSARNQILYGIIGLVIAGIAQLIVQVALRTSSSVSGSIWYIYHLSNLI